MNSTCRDFWKMVYERECGVVVMLSDLVENGEVGKCVQTRLLYNDHRTPTCLATIIIIVNDRGLPVSTATIFSSPQEVCHQYWPDGSTKGVQKYGEYSVSVLHTTKQDGFIQRTISITNPKVMG